MDIDEIDYKITQLRQEQRSLRSSIKTIEEGTYWEGLRGPCVGEEDTLLRLKTQLWEINKQLNQQLENKGDLDDKSNGTNEAE